MNTNDTDVDNGQRDVTKNTFAAPQTAAYPIIHNERERLHTLQSYHILDTAEEKDFDDLTTLAAAICRTPIALVSLVDENRQWFKSHIGLPVSETAREYSFCAHAIASPNQVMIVPDANLDERFANNPLVTGEAKITFYAGVPLVNNEGFALGSLCVVDRLSRELTSEQVYSLTVIAKQVVDKLELRRKASQLQEANQQLQQSLDTLEIIHQDLNNSEARFRHLVQYAPVAIGILRGFDLIIESANEEILRLWGKSKDIIGRKLEVGLPELAGQPFTSILQDVFVSGKPYYGYEAKIRLQYGNELKDNFFNFVYQPLKDQSNKVTAIMIVATEVTEQVMARNAMRETNDRLALALDAASLGSYEANIETGAMVCSEQCKKNFGLKADDSFNLPDMMNALLPEYSIHVADQMNAAVANNSLYHTEYEVKWPDGSVHWIMASGKTKQDEKGKVVSITGVTQNITERKEIDKRKDTFLGIVSHELKTPLTSLKASLQLLDKLKHDPTNALFPALVRTATNSTNKVNNLVDDLLQMHRFSENQLKLNKTFFNIWNMLQQTCNHVRVESRHELIIEGDKDLHILADEHRVEQVIINLVNNAVKYAPLSRNILIRFNADDTAVKMMVKDTGPGIVPEDIPHLFDRYWRADHSGVTYSGLGLGLYICAEIIQRHNGAIGVESEWGKGSEFWFTLPVNS